MEAIDSAADEYVYRLPAQLGAPESIANSSGNTANWSTPYLASD